jgi:hypothetical protein
LPIVGRDLMVRKCPRVSIYNGCACNLPKLVCAAIVIY